jgi:hypothetical protein
LSIGAISRDIPDVRSRAVELLKGQYASAAEAQTAIAALDGYYRSNYPDFYGENQNEVTAAVAALQSIYSESVFPDQKVDWQTHPSNVGHINSPGCFRCHDGKHLDANQQAIRLECNVCHSIPVVAAAGDFVTDIEISRGPEPESHRNANWISLHNESIDSTCSACHATEDAGGTSNTSFCSNSACHGSVYTYAGFDAPQLREILQSQIPAPESAPASIPTTQNPTYDAGIGTLLATKCGACHNSGARVAGLDVTSYVTLMEGGKDGAVLAAGDAAGSLLLTVQSEKHYANLSTSELETVRQWIEAGAAEE